MQKQIISVTEAARNFADCVNRAHYQDVTFVLLKNGSPVAQIIPAKEKTCSGRDLAEVLSRVRTFTRFEKENNPYEEHDFGLFDICGQVFFWKIDAYDKAMQYGSPDPTDPTQTTRVITIMKCDEY